MIRRTKEYILENKMIKNHSTVLVALSGGADSVCLLLLLNEIKRQCTDELDFALEAVHVEHGIRGAESREDARFASDLCERLHIPCHVHSVDVPQYAASHGLGLEEAARILRYEVFEEEAGRYLCETAYAADKKQGNSRQAVVAVAHHMEDNAETVLFQMLRGSGAKGLSGMHPVSVKNGVTYIRPEIKNPKKYAGQRVVIGSVTDGYNPQEEQFGNTRKLLEQLIGSDADILICTKSDLVVRDIDLLKKLGRVTVSWSINTLDENFKNDMDSASSIERRIAAMKQVYEAGIRTVCFVSPVFPGITDFEAIFERVKDQCDLFWLENLNLRGGFKKTIMDYIAGKYPDLVPLYDEIYNKHNRSYFEALEVKAEKMAKKYDCAFVDNEMPYGRVPQGHPVIVDYFYHEEIRGTENTGKRNR